MRRTRCGLISGDASAVPDVSLGSHESTFLKRKMCGFCASLPNLTRLVWSDLTSYSDPEDRGKELGVRREGLWV